MNSDHSLQSASSADIAGSFPVGSHLLIPQEVQDCIQRHAKSITMLPQHAITAMEYLDDPDVSAKAVSDVIEQDFKLATDILAIANSAFFSGGKQVLNLSDAIARIGASRCKNVIVASSIKCAMNSMDLSEEWIKEVLTRHGFLTAVLAVKLNQELKCGFGGEEFAAGLIHDFGRMLLGVSYPETFADFDPLDFDENPSVLDRERDGAGANHCDVGAWFVASQGLPDTLIEVVKHHHTPESAPTNPKLVALISCADHMANHAQRFAESEPYDPETNPFLGLLESLGVSSASSTFNKIAVETLQVCVDDANSMMIV